MVIRPRRAHQRLLPPLPNSVSCTAVPTAYYPERQLGLSVGWEHIVPRRVRLFPCRCLLPTRTFKVDHIFLLASFAQYVYGVYLGLNGQYSFKRNCPKITTLTSTQRCHFSSVPSFSSRHYYRFS